MGKSMYNLLHDVETDFSEYEVVEWPLQEMEEAKRRIYMEVAGMKQKGRQNENQAEGIVAGLEQGGVWNYRKEWSENECGSGTGG